MKLPQLAAIAWLISLSACATANTTTIGGRPPTGVSASAPTPDPRVGLKGGLHDAGTASWNLRLLSATPPPEKFAGATNSDLAFTGQYAIQGNYNGYQVWDISDPRRPLLATEYFCPASQSDVSVYKNLLFVSGESLSGRLDCGPQGVPTAVSKERLRGIRIFDITDIRAPRYLANVQTCRGSHTHTVLVDPDDADNVYIYISGSAAVRQASELPGCISALPEQDPNSALFRLEVIKVPLAHPEQAAVVSTPRIFTGLTAPARHGETPEDLAAQAAAIAKARAEGAFIEMRAGRERVVSSTVITPLLDSIVAARGGTGAPTAADTAVLRAALPRILAVARGPQPGPGAGPTQCHDITVYAAIGLAGGACEGYGMLIDISNPINPVRVAAVADSNFSYWHSATFNNDGTKILFSDEWGGGGQPKCRITDRKEWGANAIFTLRDRKMEFQSYYKLPVAQTPQENCVAHNGSLIPIPGRDVMVQAWYQGGITVFDWTDAARPVEIAYFDRGPVDTTRMASGGAWSAYWYNGVIVSSEIARGLDIFELTPGAHISQNELDAARSVRFEYFNAQEQPKLTWPPSFALARAYVDQLERSNGLSGPRISDVRNALVRAEGLSGTQRNAALIQLSAELEGEAASSDGARLRLLVDALRRLGALR